MSSGAFSGSVMGVAQTFWICSSSGYKLVILTDFDIDSLSVRVLNGARVSTNISIRHVSSHVGLIFAYFLSKIINIVKHVD